MGREMERETGGSCRQNGDMKSVADGLYLAGFILIFTGDSMPAIFAGVGCQLAAVITWGSSSIEKRKDTL